jgi:hypothetical protein
MPRDSNDGSGDTEVDPCAAPTIDPGTTCETLHVIEGSRPYNDHSHGINGANGRYQITAAAAQDALIAMGKTNSKTTAKKMWTDCIGKNTAACNAQQDAVCKQYSYMMSKAGGKNAKTISELYLRWNMGAGGANTILKAARNGQMVTDPEIIGNMDNQAWASGNPTHGDPKKFLEGMNRYIRSKGVDPNQAP